MILLSGTLRIRVFRQFCMAFPCHTPRTEDEKPGTFDVSQVPLRWMAVLLQYSPRAEIWESDSCNGDKRHRGMIAAIVLLSC